MEQMNLSASEEKQIKKLQEKGFVKYDFDLGQDNFGEAKGKIKEDKKNLIPYNCKNLVGHEGSRRFYVQTNKGKEMATKLLMREMRATDKELRLTSKDIKENVAKLKKTIK